MVSQAFQRMPIRYCIACFNQDILVTLERVLLNIDDDDDDNILTGVSQII